MSTISSTAAILTSPWLTEMIAFGNTSKPTTPTATVPPTATPRSEMLRRTISDTDSQTRSQSLEVDEGTNPLHALQNEMCVTCWPWIVLTLAAETLLVAAFLILRHVCRKYRLGIFGV